MFKVQVNKYGQAILSGDQLRELILQGKNIHHLNVNFDEEIQLFLEHQEKVLRQRVTFLGEPEETSSLEDFHNNCSEQWLIPDEYKDINVEQWLLARCKTDIEKQRVAQEYTLYQQRGLVMLLRAFIYLVDYMRANRIVWGVGRGSAVASYILYLIGIHKVNSIKYDLPISDFLKDEND